MSPPALTVLRPPAVAVVPAGTPGAARARDTLGIRSLGRRCDDATVVTTELAATRAAPHCPGAPAVRLGLRLEPAHLMLTVSGPDDVSDSDDHPPVHAPGAGSDLPEHGRGPHIVDALSEAWGRAPTVPAGTTVRARLSTHPLT